MKKLLLVAALGLFGCNEGDVPKRPGVEPQYRSLDGNVRKYVDADAGVVCYVYVAYGISCLELVQKVKHAPIG